MKIINSYKKFKEICSNHHKVEGYTFINMSIIPSEITKINTEIVFKMCTFTNCCFNNINIIRTVFYMCTFIDCSFRSTCINYCIFDKCFFDRTHFHLTEFYYSKMQYCNCTNGSSISNCDLRGIEMIDCDITMTNCTNMPIEQIVPGTGSFIGWKAAKAFVGWKVTKESYTDTFIIPAIIKLFIPASAKRLNGAKRKCRCDKAKVLKIYTSSNKYAIYDFSEKMYIDSAVSSYDNNFEYKVGEYVSVDNFDEEYNNCSTGIHFFITEKEAIEYSMMI